MNLSKLLIILLSFSVACTKESETLLPEGWDKLPGKYHGEIFYSDPTGDQYCDPCTVTVKYLEENSYTIAFEDFDIPNLNIEISRSEAELLILFDVTSTGWRLANGIQCNYFEVFIEGRNSASNNAVLCFAAQRNSVFFKFLGETF